MELISYFLRLTGSNDFAKGKDLVYMLYRDSKEFLALGLELLIFYLEDDFEGFLFLVGLNLYLFPWSLILFFYFCRRYHRRIKKFKSPTELHSKYFNFMVVIVVVHIHCSVPLVELISNVMSTSNSINIIFPIGNKLFISWSKFIYNIIGHSFLIKVKHFLQQILIYVLIR